MRQISARVPDDTYKLLRALASLQQLSQAEVLTRVLGEYAAAQPLPTRKLLRELVKRTTP